jgi:antitoxin HigA-1
LNRGHHAKNFTRIPRRNAGRRILETTRLWFRLAKDIGVPAQRIGDIVAGKRSITADTDLRLCRYFGLSDGWWLRGQASYDTAIAREAMGDVLSRISRCELLA